MSVREDSVSDSEKQDAACLGVVSNDKRICGVSSPIPHDRPGTWPDRPGQPTIGGHVKGETEQCLVTKACAA